MKRWPAHIVREYGPFEGVVHVHGLTFDGARVWFAVGDRLLAMDPASGATVDALVVPARAGTAFDGRYLYQIAGERIQKIDPANGDVVATIPTPGPDGANSGLAWAEGTLWVGQYRARKILQIDPHTGAVLRTLESNRYVTGVTWVDGELWHGTREDAPAELRRIDARSGEIIETVEMPAGVEVSGLESDGAERFYCGGGTSGTVRAVRRPRQR